jgi:hypothetical protein
MDFYAWLLFAHLAAVLGFAAAHGTSMMVLSALRRERQPDRIRALLDISLGASVWTYKTLLLVVGSGIWLGFLGGYWRNGWIWAALAILLATSLWMILAASRTYGALRIAAGLRPYRSSAQIEAMTEFQPERFSDLIVSPQLTLLRIAGWSALAALLWLMILKPF